MKIFVPSLNRSDKIKTHKLLNGLDWKIVVHDPLEAAKYHNIAGIPKDRIICSLQPRNISMQRNWILDNLCDPGEWICMMDDNISEFQCVIDEEYKEENLENKYPNHFIKNSEEFKQTYRQKMTAERLHEALEELRNKAEEVGAKFAGFSANENYFYSRGRKWKYYSLICSKACIIKNDGFRYDERIRTIDDYALSCQMLAEEGKTLVNNYIWPKSSHNKKGGLGKLSERGELKRQDCKLLMEKYPGLLRYKKRVNSLEGAEVQLRGFTQSFIKNWRESWMQKKENGLTELQKELQSIN